MIRHEKIDISRCPATLSFWDGPGRKEVHAVITHPEYWAREEAEMAVGHAVGQLRNRLPGMSLVMVRFHVKKGYYRKLEADEVGQRPADGRDSVAVAVFVEASPETGSTRHGASLQGQYAWPTPQGASVQRGAYRDVWICNDGSGWGNSEEATKEFFRIVEETAAASGGSLEGNCVRTWFFVNDIDRCYPGLVEGRNEVFSRAGLTRHTHFIASTGIGAVLDSPLRAEALVVEGLQPGQVTHLSVPERMNNTVDYGVAFERASCVDYGDRRVTYVSGTASIGPSGEILFPGDVTAQALRMADNVVALLEKAGASVADIQHAVVYVRRFQDGPVVSEVVGKRFPGVPTVVVEGPVCRPGWLVEMECVAMTGREDARYAPY